MNNTKFKEELASLREEYEGLKVEAIKAEAIKEFVGQEAKADEGKLMLSLVPSQIIRDVAEVRMYGTEKYKDPDNWKKVELKRYIDAAYRHWLAFIDNQTGKDEESGIEHYKHLACNIAFICAIMAGQI